MAGGSPVASIGASIFATTVVSQGTFGAPSVLQQGMLGSQVLKKQPVRNKPLPHRRVVTQADPDE